jgi:hypothetical protein
MVFVYWLRFLSARHLPADVGAQERTKQERTKRVTCPARGPVVYIQRVLAQGARQEPSPTACERKRTHAPRKIHPMHMYFCTLA